MPETATVEGPRGLAGEPLLSHTLFTEAQRHVFTNEPVLDEDGLHSRTGAELAAGWLEADLNRPADAAARARAVLDAYEGADPADETVRARRAEARQLLEPTEG